MSAKWLFTFKHIKFPLLPLLTHSAMTKDEAEAFEALPAFSAILAMRDWDDKAKVRLFD